MRIFWILIVLANSAPTPNAQEQNGQEQPSNPTSPAEDPTCLSMRDSVYCGPGWGDHYLDIPQNVDTTNTTGWLPQNPQRQTVEEFDKRLSTLLWTRSIMLSKEYYDCSRVTRRWFIAYTCAVILENSQRCNRNLDGVNPEIGMKPLCSEVCQEGLQGMREGFQDTNVCSANDKFNESRDAVLDRIERDCERPFVNASDNCVSGDQAEPGTCGLTYIHEECNPEFCDKAKDNPQCAAAPQSALESTRRSGVNPEGSEGSDDSGGLPVTAIVVVVFLVILGFLIFIVLYRCIHNASSSRAIPKNAPTATSSARNIGAPHNVQTQYNEDRVMAQTTGSTSGNDMLDFAGMMAKQSLGRTVHESNNRQVPNPPQPDHPFNRLAPIASASQAKGLRRVSSLNDKTSGARMGILSDGASGSNQNEGPRATGGTADLIGSDASAIGQYTALRQYTPCLNDEMELLPGDVITVSQKYDDGWAYGLNLSTGQLGVFPMGFVAPSSPKGVDRIEMRQSYYSDHDRLNQFRASMKGMGGKMSRPGEDMGQNGVGQDHENPVAPGGQNSIAALINVLDRIGDAEQQQAARDLANSNVPPSQSIKEAKALAQSAEPNIKNEEERFSFSALMDVLDGAEKRTQEHEKKKSIAPYDFESKSHLPATPPGFHDSDPGSVHSSRSKTTSAELDELDQMLKQEEYRMKEALNSLHKVKPS